VNVDPRASFAQVLGGVLQAAQLGLKRAEKQQEKAVQRVREVAQEVLSHKAQTMGAVVGEYAVELQQAALDLEAVVNSSQKVIDAATASDHSNAAFGPEVESRSKATVAVEVASRSVRSARRQYEHLVQQAQGDAEQALEDSADTLSRRVGDMTPELNQAKASLKSAVEQGQVATGKSHIDRVNSTPSKGDVVARMQALGAYVKSAQAASKARVAKAKATVDASIAKADKEMAAKVKDMMADLTATEQAEVSGLKAPRNSKATQMRGSSKTRKQATKEIAAAKPATVKFAEKLAVKVVTKPVKS